MTPNAAAPPQKGAEAPATTKAYTQDRFRYTRRKTRVVRVGDIPVGGLEPIRIQSMTTSLTWDVPKTVDQIEALVRVGCEIVRVTVPTQKDAEALPAIREEMKRRRLKCPLVADIHFSPTVAMLAVEHVEKIRVNPGNFSDGSKKFFVKEYTDDAYSAELARMEKLFAPLVLRAKAREISMRIGTNHGSLSDRIVNRFGDSPLGMVESALEFVRICEKLDYRDLIISMKASNTLVMVEAYRLLAARMAEESMDYPFHLGVTEAGDGDDGRIKSAIGIGSLLEDGIGDTIRVSLTEDSTKEIPPCFALAKRYSDLSARLRAKDPALHEHREGGDKPRPYGGRPVERETPIEIEGGHEHREGGDKPRPYGGKPVEREEGGDKPRPYGDGPIRIAEADTLDPYAFARRKTRRTEQGPKFGALGADQVPRVELDLGSVTPGKVAVLAEVASQLSGPGAGDRRLEVASVHVPGDSGLEGLEKLRAALTERKIDVILDARVEREIWRKNAARVAAACDRVTPLGLGLTGDDDDLRTLAREVAKHEDHAILIEIDAPAALAPASELPGAPTAYARLAERIAKLVALALSEKGPHGPPQAIAALQLPAETMPVQAWRALAAALDAKGLDVPILLATAVRPRPDSGAAAPEDTLLQAALRLGALLVDGIGDAVRIDGLPDPRRALDLAYGILQGARARTTKTEYISCPSCGRTLFNLETTTAKIKGKTDHLKGVKIAVMGCIVNGPGEMADADFGYVGWKPGKVNLYVGKEVVVRDVEEVEAADRLVQLIKDRGRWNDPAAKTP